MNATESVPLAAENWLRIRCLPRRCGAAESSATYTQLRTRLDTSYGLHQEDASRRAARWRVGQAEVMLKFALPPQKVMVVYRFQPYADQLARAIEQSRSSAAGDGR